MIISLIAQSGLSDHKNFLEHHSWRTAILQLKKCMVLIEQAIIVVSVEVP